MSEGAALHSPAMRFAKLHGLGNDFLLFDLRDQPAAAPMTPARAIELCDRHRGVGGDGVLTLLRAEGGVRMLVHNSDGSVPEMCGNGARCAALYVATEGCTRPAVEARVLLLTGAGPRPCIVSAAQPGLGEVSIGMGRPVVEAARALPLGNRRALAIPVSMGNPHRVFFLEPEEGARPLEQLAQELGPVLCRAENANIEFVTRLGPRRWKAAVWERGAGFTQACGTGACAVAAAAVSRGDAQAGDELSVELPGGALALTVDRQSGELQMKGPAQLVFRGEL